MASRAASSVIIFPYFSSKLSCALAAKAPVKSQAAQMRIFGAFQPSI
jgi:hypothetical protein